MPRSSQSRRGLLAVLALLAAPLDGWTAPATGVTPEVKVAICEGGDDLGPWMGVVGPALARPLGAADISGVRLRRNMACRALHLETACVAGVYDEGGRGIACAPQTLLILLRASAWYALARRPGETYEALRLRSGAGFEEAGVHFADGQAPDPAIEHALAALPRQEPDGALDPAGRTFLMTLGLTYAAVFGHESGHLYESAPFCGVPVRSRVEDSGLLAAIYRVQTSDELFKPMTLDQGEYTADRCATRRIRQTIDRYRERLPPGQLADLRFAQRAAADIISFALLVHDGSAHPRPSASPVDGYLYPPLRILALGAELDATDKPRICGAAAQALVVTTQADYRAFPGKGQLPDDLEAALPPRLADAWNNKVPWSPAAFACPND